MKIKGSFVIREFVGEEYVLVPVGETALEFSKLGTLNGVGKFIWEYLEKEHSREEVIQAVYDTFDGEYKEITADVDEFLGELKKIDLLE